MKGLLFIALIAYSPWLWGQHTLTGLLLDQSNNDPLTGAYVQLENSQWSAVTGPDGQFELTGLQADSYDLNFSFLGYSDTTISVTIPNDQEITVYMRPKAFMVDEVIVTATRANEQIATAQTTVEQAEIEQQNLGQDLPWLLNQTPSLVVTSDAGAGVGYTSMRIRGSDQTRINVTINGVPLNDPESQGVFWVNMPDFASSVENVQIQRGIGTSTNGAAAFGATVNFQTTSLQREAYGQISNSVGSFNTRKHTAEFGTGLINKHWSVNGRLSSIHSDGYVDRATSDLQSYYLSAGYSAKNTLLKFITFSGKERTYQSWWGVPESYLDTNRTYNYYTYENEVDNYEQTHYQLHFSQQISDNFLVNVAGHYTRGAGYFEQYREGDDFADYGLPLIVVNSDTIASTDLIRRRWLDNHFYGFTFSGKHTGDKLGLTIGGAWNKYDGDHYGEIIWSEWAANQMIRERYYDNTGLKTDWNWYAKITYRLGNGWNAFADLQLRQVGYEVAGIDNDQRMLSVDEQLTFFNPKVGINWRPDDANALYLFAGIGNREPTRNDYIDAPDGVIPQPETMYDVELGYEFSSPTFSASANGYLMYYKNQLVLTGELNDVGSAVRTNVPTSYRAGVELQLGWQPFRTLAIGGNITLSQNQIIDFTETAYVYDMDFNFLGTEMIEHGNTPISYSPGIIAGTQVTYKPLNGLQARWQTKYVGRQYLDNTDNIDRSIDPYFINDFIVQVTWQPNWIEAIDFKFGFYNFTHTMYESNGYTYGWFYDEATETNRDYYNYYYPQAGINFLGGVTLRF